MDRWDILIIAAAAYVAVVSLVRLMAARRNKLIDHVREQVEQQRPKQAAGQQPGSEDADRGAA